MAVTFRTNLFQAEGMNATGIVVPAEAVSELNSGKKPSVVVNVNGYVYRSTVAVMGGEFMIPLAQVHRSAAGVEAGEEIEVTLELDTQPRTVEVPEDLSAALSAQAGALGKFEASSYSKRKEWVRQVEDAKTPETRTRRIAAVVAALALS